MKTITIGILGLGTVGCGVISALQKNAQEIRRRCGYDIKIAQVCVRDLNKERAVSLEGIDLVKDPFELVQNDKIEVVLELIGGTAIARELALLAVSGGKHLVTANKALIAQHGEEIFAQAAKHNVIVNFEAAVAGGIPIIKALREGLCANQIEWIAGIINGTCNFILTEMSHKQTGFKDALASAQMRGYAEADPRFDVEGIDAAHKLAIMASMAWGCSLKFDQVHVEGITQVHPEDIQYATELGYRIKHLGFACRTPAEAQGDLELRVHPTLVPMSSMLAYVEQSMNAVLVQGNVVGETLYYGAGAGAEETASAVLADVVDIVRMRELPAQQRMSSFGFSLPPQHEPQVVPIENSVSAYYLRMIAQDKPGVMAKITGILAQQDISIEAMLQKESHHGESRLPIVLLTHSTCEKDLRKAIDIIQSLKEVSEEVIVLRVATFDHQSCNSMESS